jgi:large subunit ribosomal protein L6
MSRIAKQPVVLPKGVEVTLNGTTLAVKGPKGRLEMPLHEDVTVKQEDGVLKVAVAAEGQQAIALPGTTRALAANMVRGVSEGFERKLELVGVGYRASVSGKDLNLSLGFSHPIVFKMPEGITIETPTQTEILVKGTDKQRVGEVAAKIRGYRPPEPYKGKGVRYSGEKIIMKEAKKA